MLNETDGSTRLISRNRFRLPTFISRVGMLPMEAGSPVMERKMLLVIKQRAEQLATFDAETSVGVQLHPVSSLGPGGFDTTSLKGGPDEQRPYELQVAVVIRAGRAPLRRGTACCGC